MSTDIVSRLENALDQTAVCHCGDLCRDHTQLDNHAASWNPDPHTQLLNDARHVILLLRMQQVGLTFVAGALCFLGGVAATVAAFRLAGVLPW